MMAFSSTSTITKSPTNSGEEPELIERCTNLSISSDYSISPNYLRLEFRTGLNFNIPQNAKTFAIMLVSTRYTMA